MIRISFLLLYAASARLFSLIAAAQSGPGWGVPWQAAGGVMPGLFTVMALIALSEFTLWFNRKTFIHLHNGYRLLFIIWSAVILAIVVVSWDLNIFQWPVRYPALSRVLKEAFWPGTLISTMLLGILLYGSQKLTPQD